jgi:hypothetical protein
MTLNSTFSRQLGKIINTLGLSCMGGAIFLQILVFVSIAQQGYFRAIETNPFILGLEIALTAFTAIYFVHLYRKLIQSSLNQ